MKKLTTLLSLTILFSLSVQSVMACGPFTVDPLFSFTRHADYPLNDYAKGKIGIVPSSYGRMSLFVFYRQLNNLPLSTKEQEQFTKALSERIGVYTPDGEEPVESPAPKNEAIEQWKTSRAKVFKGDPKLETEKRLPDEYFSYTSCLDDAFRNAANTLDARIAKFGVNADVKEWLNGQDAVFANCGDGGKMPSEIGENAPDWLKKDRAYQIAAALLYSGKNVEARAGFQQISQDNNSPWNKTAKFVVARTYIREASLLEDNEQNKNAKMELFQKAESELKQIIADSSMKEFQASANRLLGLIGFRAKPREQRRQLAENLVQKGENPNLYNDLIDYIWLLDKVDSEANDAGQLREAKEAEKAGKEPSYEYNLKRIDIPAVELGADLTDWLFTYQAEDGFAHSYDKWKQTNSLAWLVTTIYKAKKDSANLQEIINEADKIKSDSPAYATIKHHQIRLLIDTGKQAEAKQKLDEVSANFSKYTRSTQNDFTSQKMQIAGNLNDYLKFAQRQAATFVWSDDANEKGDDLKGENQLAIWKNRTMFDYDSVAQFNEKMPLSVLRQAALNQNLPNHLKKFLVIAVWTRAFVLGNTAIQTEFTPLMAQFAPEYKVSGVSNQTNFLLGILRNPAIQIYVPTGYGRGETGTNSIDSIRGNWWCIEKNTEYDYPAFLTAAQKAESETEQKKLAALGDSATLLARTAVEFANKNITNPNTPEILHLAVRSTRYGCKDANTLRYSKAAFDILHKKFPRNEWTKKTPYYFGEREN